MISAVVMPAASLTFSISDTDVWILINLKNFSFSSSFFMLDAVGNVNKFFSVAENQSSSHRRPKILIFFFQNLKFFCLHFKFFVYIFNLSGYLPPLIYSTLISSFATTKFLFQLIVFYAWCRWQRQQIFFSCRKSNF